MLRVGLTGGIATGKTHVRRRFEARGLATLDLDSIAHELLAAGGAGRDAVVGAFGRGVLSDDGAVDRKALGARVFGDEAARGRLNAILHPLIRRREERLAATLAAGGEPLLVTDAALIVEIGSHLRFERLVVVHCSEQEQLARLMKRDGLALEAARARVSAQMPGEEKRGFAHFVIESSGTLAETDAQADSVAEELGRLGRARPTRAPLDEERALGLLLHGAARGPRGLTPPRLLRESLAAGGLELQVLAQALDPPARGPWYRAADSTAAEPGPESLCGALVLWTLARRGADADFLMGAAASVARLTHAPPEWRGRACVAAGLLLDAAVTGALPRDPAAQVARWTEQARRFATIPRGWQVVTTVAAALAHSADPPAAAAAARRSGGDADLAGALVGLVSGPCGRRPPDDWVAAVRQLEAWAREGGER